MRVFAVAATALAVFAVQAGSAGAATKKVPPDPVMRSASGTVIQPTKTIIHHQDGSTTVIVFRDYMMPPGGDPGRANWTMGGPDLSGNGNYLPMAAPLYIPGFNPYAPY
jgi:hypothetical protein